jgi:hypothetical protein
MFLQVLPDDDDDGQRTQPKHVAELIPVYVRSVVFTPTKTETVDYTHNGMMINKTVSVKISFQKPGR